MASADPAACDDQPGEKGGGALDAARQLDETIESAQLFLYPRDRHLFADNVLPDYDEKPRHSSRNACSAFSTTSRSWRTRLY
jgi:hypothetical protein